MLSATKQDFHNKNTDKHKGLTPVEIGKYIDLIYDETERMLGVDFTDCIYKVANYSKWLPFFDIVFVDEAQDLSVCQLAIINKLKQSNPKMRLIAVGDSNQAIYGFAGGNSESFNSIKEGKDVVVIPLSVSLRCSNVAVQIASKYNSLIQSASFAKDGFIKQIDENELMVQTCLDGLGVISRTNAPLMILVFKLIRNKIPAKIVGRDIAAMLIKMIRQYNSISDLVSSLNQSKASLTISLMESLGLSQEEVEESNDYKIESDKLMCILNVVSETEPKTIEQLASTIEDIFLDPETKTEKNGVILMTAHKSKGLEFDNIAVLYPEIFDKIPFFVRVYAQKTVF